MLLNRYVCCNRAMSNTNFDPRQPQGASGPQYQPSYQQPPKAHRFFQWIRESHVMRTNDRVIAGVCGAIARELGWNVVLVRVLMVVLAFFGGTGAILYAFGWFLLPDELTGAILCEELINGRWDWSYIGVILCILISGVISFSWGLHIHVFPLLLAMLAMYLLIDNGRRRYMQPMNEPRPAAPNPQNTAPSQQSYMQNNTSAYPSQSEREPMTSPAPTPQPQAQPQQQAAFTGMPQQQAPRPVPPVQPTPQPPLRPVQPQVITKRRKPAGPVIVLLVSGLLLMAYAWFSLTQSRTTLHTMVGPSAIFTGTICIALGILIIVLGCLGRRTGGLHPYAWISMFIALTLGGTAILTGTIVDYAGHNVNDYQRVYVTSARTVHVGAAELKQMTHGIAVEGKNYDESILTYDLTDYSTSHEVLLNNGTRAKSTCPTGRIPMTVTDAQVRFILPEGCSWGFNNTDDDSDVFYSTSTGNKYSVMTSTNPFNLTNPDFRFVNVTTTHGEFVNVDVPPFVRVQSGFDPDEEDYDDFEEDDSFVVPGYSDFCEGVRTDNGEVTVEDDASEQTQRLINSGKYWPCAVDANKAVAQPELIIDANILVASKISVGYEKITTD